MYLERKCQNDIFPGNQERDSKRKGHHKKSVKMTFFQGIRNRVVGGKSGKKVSKEKNKCVSTCGWRQCVRWRRDEEGEEGKGERSAV